MANLFTRAHVWAAAKLQSKMGTAVVYTRGALSIPITATISRTLFRTSDPSNGATIRIVTRDFLITAADLEAEGLVLPPARGDEIEETGADGLTYTHKLLPISGEPFWKWLDNGRQVLRIHTKQTGAT